MRHHVFAALFAASAFAMIVSAHAQACDCGSRAPTRDEAFERAALVVEGRVTRVLPDALAVAVARVWKGKATQAVTVRNEGGSCAYRFKEGEAVVLYAGEAEGRFYVRQCANAVRVVQGREVGDEVDSLRARRPKP
jgi:hypothetical protein